MIAVLLMFIEQETNARAENLRKNRLCFHAEDEMTAPGGSLMAIIGRETSNGRREK
ncbi:MAG: hypothetical protein WCH05_06715 [Chlorobiaceae bacterium]